MQFQAEHFKKFVGELTSRIFEVEVHIEPEQLVVKQEYDQEELKNY